MGACSAGLLRIVGGGGLVLIAIGQSGLPRLAEQADRDTLVALHSLVGKPRVISVALLRPGIGRMRLTLAGESIEVEAQVLQMLMQIVEQIGPLLDNAILRERLVTESADTERARIGRDLHEAQYSPTSVSSLHWKLSGVVPVRITRSRRTLPASWKW